MHQRGRRAVRLSEGLDGVNESGREAMYEVRRDATPIARSPIAQKRASPECSTRRGAAAAKR